MPHSDAYYHSMAAARDVGLSGDAHGRAVMPMSRGWRRFHPDAELLWIDDVDGVPRWITATQARLWELLATFDDGTVTTMREMAEKLDVARSTVSRGMVKFASFGRLTYSATHRGRYSRTIVYTRLRLVAPDVAKRMRDAAKARVRAWAKAAEDRVSRLRSNVATRFTWKEIEDHGLEAHYLLSMVATLNEPWEIAEDARA